MILKNPKTQVSNWATMSVTTETISMVPSTLSMSRCRRH